MPVYQSESESEKHQKNYVETVMVYRRLRKIIKNRATKVIQKIYPDFGINKFSEKAFLTYVYKKKVGLLKASSRIEVLALRGSGADYDFLDLKTDTSYNLGLTSTDLHATYHLYEYSLRYLKNLKHILIFFVPIAPGYSLIKIKEKYRAVAYKYFFEIPYQDSKAINRKVEAQIFEICNHLKEPKVSEGYRGYDRKKYLSPNTDIRRRASAHLRENKREPDQMFWLDASLKLADKNKHKVWIIVPPMRSDFKRLLPSHDILFSKLYNMEIGSHRILNFYNDVDFNDSDQGDSDHLNEEGAVKLTNKILFALQSEK